MKHQLLDSSGSFFGRRVLHTEYSPQLNMHKTPQPYDNYFTERKTNCEQLIKHDILRQKMNFNVELVSHETK